MKRLSMFWGFKMGNLKMPVAIILVITGMVGLGCKSQRQREQPAEVEAETEAETAVVQDIPEGWTPLFDGETLTGWEIVRYGGEGEAYVKDGVLVLPMATSGLLTGVIWVGDTLPVNNYTIYYEARRVAGHDIFAGLSFPYKDTFASLIIGGWAGIVNGLSCIDGYDASENETTNHFALSDNIWYPVELRVTTDSISVDIGSEHVFDLATAGKRIHLRPGSYTESLTLWTYLSTGEIRNFRIKKL